MTILHADYKFRPAVPNLSIGPTGEGHKINLELWIIDGRLTKKNFLINKPAVIEIKPSRGEMSCEMGQVKWEVLARACFYNGS